MTDWFLFCFSVILFILVFIHIECIETSLNREHKRDNVLRELDLSFGRRRQTVLSFIIFDDSYYARYANEPR